jgi:excisionase family DNA binding protein
MNGHRPSEPELGTREVVADDQRMTYTVDEVAARLGVSRSAVYDCISRGEIPAKRLGRRVVIVRAALETFLTEPNGARRASVHRARRPA